VDAIEAHEQDTNQYDQQAVEWGWNPVVFFGQMGAYALPGKRLLDVGIGTGLCSEPFFKAGVEISGFDGSEKMLRCCRNKHISDDLKKHLFEDVPWPYEDACFDLVIAGGVLHFLGSLELFFKEAKRVLKPKGVFSFTTAVLDQGNVEKGALPADESYARVLDAASGVRIYKHGERYIQNLLETLGMTAHKKLTFLASRNPQTGAEHYNTLFVAR
jgi:predicted TPR repeat methyltransferase